MEDKKWEAYYLLSLLVWASALFLASPLHGQQSERGYWITETELTQLEQALTTAQNELTQSNLELEKLYNITEGLKIELSTLKTSWQEYEQGVMVQRTVLISAVVVLAGALVYQIVTDN